jgi:hypothetical protein
MLINKLIVHGCLLRFGSPRVEDGKSYLVEPQFVKRSDAKSAVALLAISQNVGGWIRDVTLPIENLITPEMRTKAGTLMAPLNQECARGGLVGQPFYTYIHEEGGTCQLSFPRCPNHGRVTLMFSLRCAKLLDVRSALII